MREGMSMPEEMRENMGLPKGVEETVGILREATEGPERKKGRAIIQEQIDNLLEAAFDADSGLSAEEKKGIQEAAATLKGDLVKEDEAWDKLKEELVEAGWFGEGEAMTKKYGAN